MKKKELTLNTEHGLHLRVAGEIVTLVKSHECKVSLSCEGCKFANACSIMQLLTLGATKGSKVQAHAEGPDEEEVMAKLSAILGNGDGI